MDTGNGGNADLWLTLLKSWWSANTAEPKLEREPPAKGKTCTTAGGVRYMVG